ncbi:unnamed protein product [marine sediment metagenome]|uniref:Uncharacterized protein n=1 Tax=marine sediment metagenome TaxID=412755 RepID=X1B5X6_9ZZZZ
MIIMDTRISEFSPIQISRYVSELDLLSNPVLKTQEKEYLADLYDFMERDLDPDLKKLLKKWTLRKLWEKLQMGWKQSRFIRN